eukprot:6800851-Alexandrium_andersonii.AAC.1
MRAGGRSGRASQVTGSRPPEAMASRAGRCAEPARPAWTCTRGAAIPAAGQLPPSFALRTTWSAAGTTTS